MRTGIYLRISQDRTGDAAGVARQQQDCEALAAELGWQIVEIYVDNDISASSGTPRPAYRRMLGDMQADRLDAVICWHPDRLYRRPIDLEELIEIVEAHKVMIRTCRAGDIDLSTGTGKMIARILGAVSRGEVDRMAERWRRSYEQRREAGQWMGSGPRTFGYNRDGTVNIDEAAIVKRIAAAVLDGATVTEICRQLDADGVTTTRGNAWTPTALRYLLRNPRLAGLVSVRGEITGHEARWQPILDRETWEAVRAIVEARATGPRQQSTSLLADLALCAYPVGGGPCGNRLTRTVTSTPVYQCRTGAMSNRHVTVSARALEEMVESAAQTILSRDGAREAAERRLNPATPAALVREIADLEDQLAELRDSLALAKRDTTRADVVRAIDAVRDEIDDRRARIGPFSGDPLPVLPDEWPDDVPRRSRLVRLVVQRVWVSPAATRGRFDPERIHIEPVEGL